MDGMHVDCNTPPQRGAAWRKRRAGVQRGGEMSKEGALEESSMHKWRKKMVQRRDTESAGVDDKHSDRDSVFLESVVEAVVTHRQEAREMLGV